MLTLTVRLLWQCDVLTMDKTWMVILGYLKAEAYAPVILIGQFLFVTSQESILYGIYTYST